MNCKEMEKPNELQSSMEMEDSSSSSSFSVRVDKIFGSLSSSSLTSLWSLTDEEIEKKQWNRDLNRLHDDDERLPPNFLGFSNQLPQPQDSSSLGFSTEFESDSQNLNQEQDDDDEQPSSTSNEKNKNKKQRLTIVDGNNDDELDVRASIGLDCTLDYEEEEDEYDKVAVGKENEGDRLYMRDVTDHDGIDVNTYRELPDSIGSRHVDRDPRANHLAAKLRLTEDTEAAGNFHSLNLSDHSQTTTHDDNASIPKPILKKRPTQSHSKSLKRVRFDPHFDNLLETGQAHHVEPTPTPTADGDGGGDDDDNISARNLPDYLKNPTKYTRYTLDSPTDMDDESNGKAYMDFLKLPNKPIITCEADPADSSKPPTFTSRKPSTVKGETQFKQNQEDVSQGKSLSIGIAAQDIPDTDIDAMEEDEPEVAVERSLLRPNRQYRTRACVDSEQQVTT